MLSCCFFLTFYFVLGYRRLTHSIVIISGEHQRDSAIPVQVSILPQTRLPPRQSHDIEQSFMETGRIWVGGPVASELSLAGRGRLDLREEGRQFQQREEK